MQDIKKFRERIKQCPVIEGMTKEQLDEFYKHVHEEKHGNTSNVWDIVPGSGASYQVESKPMSDDLNYGDFNRQERKRLHEEHEVLAARSNKQKQIEDCEKYIAKQELRIKQIQADKVMTVQEKQQKIQRCLDRINIYKQDIVRVKEYLAIQADNDRKIFEKHNDKTK